MITVEELVALLAVGVTEGSLKISSSFLFLSKASRAQMAGSGEAATAPPQILITGAQAEAAEVDCTAEVEAQQMAEEVVLADAFNHHLSLAAALSIAAIAEAPAR